MEAHLSRKSRKVQRRRKWKRRLAHRAVSPADAMHQALGEFLTEMGHVEFQMLLLMDFLNEAPIEALSPKPLGGRSVKRSRASKHGVISACWRLKNLRCRQFTKI